MKKIYQNKLNWHHLPINDLNAPNHEFKQKWETTKVLLKNELLEGKNIILTGGSLGIGKETAKALVDKGANVLITGRSEERLITASKYTRSQYIEFDIGEIDTISGNAKKCVELLDNRVDVLINNAGVTLLDSALSTDIEDWEKVLATNLSAPFMIAKNLAPKMIEQRSGKIVNISSLASEYALENHIAYSVSKSGLNMMTKAMTAEWTRYNIQVNSVCPTVVMTSMGELAWGDPEKSAPMLAKIPLGRFGQPTEIADLVLFLSSNASDFICGQSIFIDGGFSVM